MCNRLGQRLIIGTFLCFLAGCGADTVTITNKVGLKKPSLSASACDDTATEICLTATSTDAGVTAFDFYLGGNQVGTAADGKFKVKGLNPQTSYSFTAIARDSAHSSPQSNPATAMTAAALAIPTLTGSACGDIMKEVCLAVSNPDKMYLEFLFFKDSQQAGTSKDGKFRVTNLTPNTLYSFTAAGKDRTRTSSQSIPVVMKTAGAHTVAVIGTNQLPAATYPINAYFVATSTTDGLTNQVILQDIKATPYHATCTTSGAAISCSIPIPEGVAGYMLTSSSMCGTATPDADDYVSPTVAVNSSTLSVTLNLDRRLSIQGTQRFCLSL